MEYSSPTEEELKEMKEKAERAWKYARDALQFLDNFPSDFRELVLEFLEQELWERKRKLEVLKLLL